MNFLLLMQWIDRRLFSDTALSNIKRGMEMQIFTHKKLFNLPKFEFNQQNFVKSHPKIQQFERKQFENDTERIEGKK